MTTSSRCSSAIRFALLLGLSLAGVARVRDAGAQSSADRVDAEVLFQDGRKLVAEGKYAEGCAKLEASQRLDPGTGTLFNLADCQEKNGRLATSWAMFLEVASGARAAGNTAREQAARDRAAAVAKRMPRLALKVTASVAPGFTLKRDGVVVDRALWGSFVPVDPGPRQIEASAPGQRGWSKTVVVENAPVSLTIEVPALEAEGASPAPAPSDHVVTPGEQPRPGGGPRWAGVALLGAGTIGVTMGAVFGLSARSKWNEARSYCVVGNECWQTGLDLADDARSRATISTLAFVGGGLALGGGALILLLPSRDARSASRGIVLVASTGRASAGVQLSGQF
jgi:hypothetical protein